MADPEPKFPIVGIGASAGGVEALELFFRVMPPDAGMAFVIVTHLSPKRVSLLHEVLARFTAMPVVPARDGVDVVPDHVFVLPENAVIGIRDGRLKVQKSDPLHRERKPIDLFFSELAADQGEYAAAVVLSGLDGDGTLGVKAIKERDGLTIAQSSDGTKPRYSDMPESAISSGMIDFAIPVEAMADRLQQFSRGLSTLHGMGESERAFEDGTLTDARAEIYGLLGAQTGHDFSGYKMKTFLRRIQRRMQVQEIANLPDYAERLRRDPAEVSALFRDLLINVTDFFRDADAFAALKDLVVPKLFEGRGEEGTIRVWVPGCATGEEVYSIGILLREHIETLRTAPRVQIFATDIDEHSLASARAARYPAPLLEGVSPERLARYFVKDGNSYIVDKSVRDLCIFSPHSVIRDPPFSRMDLVSCRNLLIYLVANVQSQVLPTFHYSLRPAGYLFLGMSENISKFSHLFTPVERKHRIFKATKTERSELRMPLVVKPIESELSPLRLPSLVPLRHGIQSHVMDRYAPPHVVIDRQGDIVYYSARTGKYLEPSVGAPSRQLLNMARKGLRQDLRSALREAFDGQRHLSRDNIAVQLDDGRSQSLSITIDTVNQDDDQDPLFLILFFDLGIEPGRRDETTSPFRVQPNEVAIDLELRDTRDRLQSLVEEYETALEELKSSNEELVSVNEELQSANEELEASKEELQSLNEELQTVNVELGLKVDALDVSNNDLRNLFESTQVATIFLDANLVIRNFTPPAMELFHIQPGDRGRPLADFSSRISYADLHDDLRETLRTGQPVERHVRRLDGEAYFLARIRPYNKFEGDGFGVIITLADVTELTTVKARLDRMQNGRSD